MPPSAVLFETQELDTVQSTSDPVAVEARQGLTATPKSLSPWLFYDQAGSDLFEQITTLPEYYLTRTERDIFTTHAADIFAELGCPVSDGISSDRGEQTNLTIAELGAGTASKTGILLRALTARQPHVLYQPIDISPTALDEADAQIERSIPGVTVRPLVANYVTDSFHIERPPHAKILVLYIGSSIGNFSPTESRAVLSRLRSQLQPGDALLLGTDLAPCPPDVDAPAKSTSTLLAAYNDKAGINADFNRNMLFRLNRELGADFDPDQFVHRALWNHTHSRIEMHLQALAPQTVHIPANAAGPALTLHFAASETIHTENSYKFTPATIAALLGDSGFAPSRTFTDPHNLFAVTLATAS